MAITINDKHSFLDYGLVLSSKVIGSPPVKKNSVEIMGGDGVIDLTNWFGAPKYSNRTLTFVFTRQFDMKAKFVEFWEMFLNELQGQDAKIILDEDPEYFYYGKVDLNYTQYKNVYTINMIVDAEPYKTKVKPTVVDVQFQKTHAQVNLKNMRKTVVPYITVSGNTDLLMNGYTRNIPSAGRWALDDMPLNQGDNIIDININSVGQTATFDYQEGTL